MLEHFMILVGWHNNFFLFTTIMLEEFWDSNDLDVRGSSFLDDNYQVGIIFNFDGLA
jgi:hypothetical protein